MELLIAIATLCQIPSAPRITQNSSDWQLQCQKEYIQCYRKKSDNVIVRDAEKLVADCVLEKK